jgi:hypothetical protein
MDRLLYNLFYYKTLITSFIFPQSSAISAYKLFETPKYPPRVPEWEKEFEKENKFNIIKVPYKEHINTIKERMVKNSMNFELTRLPNFPEELTVLEYLPNPDVPKREETIICAHGWDGRSFNYYKFIPKLQAKGFRVLAPDFPRHGKTEGIESGCHVFGHSINALIRYVNSPVYILAHSVANGAFGVNYGISSEAEKNLIKRYVAIAFPNHSLDIVEFFENNIGLSSRCHPYFYAECSNKLGFDLDEIRYGDIISKYDIPILLIHDKDDKELKFENAVKSATLLQHKNYKVNGEIKPCFFESEGLGHRRILRDDGIVDRVVEFFSEDIELKD